MPSENDLFAEEQTMVSMSFGDHIEELRRHLILGVLGLFVGVTITFIPPFNLGQRVMTKMQEPAQEALDEFYTGQAKKRQKAAEVSKSRTQPFEVQVNAEDLANALRALDPTAKSPPKSALKDKTFPIQMTYREGDWIDTVHSTAEKKGALVSLAPLETFMIYFMVCMVTGLVISSPWVFYQVWAFIAAGLYRHERHYVRKFIPFSLGLFLAGVFLCFFIVLPYTLQFLLDFNIWLGIEPTLRITDWISFATILPLVFGVCFQTPLVMLLLERIGVFTVKDFREKRKFAVLIIVVAAAVITPTGDPFTMLVLAIPMYALYELGIIIIGPKRGLPATLNS